MRRKNENETGGKTERHGETGRDTWKERERDRERHEECWKEGERERVRGKWVNEELSNEWRYIDGIRERIPMSMHKVRRDPDRLQNRRNWC